MFINYGIEALDDEVLRQMRKALTVQQITEGIDATLVAGISPGFNILFGNIGDTRATLRKAVDFLVKYDDGGQFRTIRPVTPYPGCELYKRAIAEGKLSGPADFYERAHTNSEFLAANFTDMTDQDFHDALRDANCELIANYYRNKGTLAVAECRKMYDSHDTTFRGFRHKV